MLHLVTYNVHQYDCTHITYYNNTLTAHFYSQAQSYSKLTRTITVHLHALLQYTCLARTITVYLHQYRYGTPTQLRQRIILAHVYNKQMDGYKPLYLYKTLGMLATVQRLRACADVTSAEIAGSEQHSGCPFRWRNKLGVSHSILMMLAEQHPYCKYSKQKQVTPQYQQLLQLMHYYN